MFDFLLFGTGENNRLCFIAELCLLHLDLTKSGSRDEVLGENRFLVTIFLNLIKMPHQLFTWFEIAISRFAFNNIDVWLDIQENAIWGSTDCRGRVFRVAIFSIA